MIKILWEYPSGPDEPRWGFFEILFVRYMGNKHERIVGRIRCCVVV